MIGRFRIRGLAGLTLGLAANLAIVAAAAAAAPVMFVDRPTGARLTTLEGLTLYTFSGDQKPGLSACIEKCAEIWPPLLATVDAAADGEFAVIERDGGTRQWTHRGRPLYRYNRDTRPGDAFGDGVARKWWAAESPMKMPPQASLTRANQGIILADAKQLTLYISDSDKPAMSNCDAACARIFKPLAAPAAARSIGAWTIVSRSDGARQWAFQSRPLYRFVDDTRPRDTFADGKDNNWHVVVLTPPPAIPSWARYAQSDAEELLVDATGKTLYARDMARGNNADNFDPSGSESGHFDFSPEAVMPYFKPVLAEAPRASEPVGSWTVIDFHGRKQWAYRAMPLFVHVEDVLPGDLKGIKGTDRSYTTITRSGEPMQGTGR